MKKRTLGVLRCYPFKAGEGIGPHGGVAILFRHHLFRLLRENGIGCRMIGSPKDLKGCEALVIPVINKYILQSPEAVAAVERAKKMKLYVSAILHGDILEMHRLENTTGKYTKLINLIDGYGYVGRDDRYKKYVNRKGADFYKVIHPYYRRLAIPDSEVEWDKKSKLLYADLIYEKRKGFCNWTRIANEKLIDCIPDLLPKGQKCHLYGTTGGFAHFYLEGRGLLKDPRNLVFEKKIDGYHSYLRLLKYKFAIDLTYPGPHETGRSQYVELEMFDLGHIPIVFKAWNHGYKGVMLPNPKAEGRRYTPLFKKCRRKILEAFKEWSPEDCEKVAVHNRKFLKTVHDPQSVFKAWLKMTGL